MTADQVTEWSRANKNNGFLIPTMFYKEASEVLNEKGGLTTVYGWPTASSRAEDQYKKVLNGGSPMYLNTDLFSGHVILGVGYDENGIYVNDPAGKFVAGAPLFPRNPDGKSVQYPWSWMGGRPGNIYNIGKSFIWNTTVY